MIVIATFVSAVADILGMVIYAYIWIVIIASLITWVRPDPYNPIVQMLDRLTRPAFEFVQRYVPSVGGLDLSPIMIILGLQFVNLFFVNLLKQIALSLAT